MHTEQMSISSWQYFQSNYWQLHYNKVQYYGNISSRFFLWMWNFFLAIALYIFTFSVPPEKNERIWSHNSTHNQPKSVYSSGPMFFQRRCTFAKYTVDFLCKTSKIMMGWFHNPSIAILNRKLKNVAFSLRAAIFPLLAWERYEVTLRDIARRIKRNCILNMFENNIYFLLRNLFMVPIINIEALKLLDLFCAPNRVRPIILHHSATFGSYFFK